MGLLRVADTLPAADYQPIWEITLRFYRARRPITEADRAHTAHAMIGVDTVPVVAERAPVFIDASRTGRRPFDQAWLEKINADHLVAGICTKPLDHCEATGAVTFLNLSDPFETDDGGAGLEVWETALDPAHCRRGQGLIDIQGVDVRLVRAGGVWVVPGTKLTWHAFAACSPSGWNR